MAMSLTVWDPADISVKNNKVNDVVVDQSFDPMQTEVDVIIEEREIVRGKKSIVVDTRKTGNHAAKQKGSTKHSSVSICVGPIANASMENNKEKDVADQILDPMQSEVDVIFDEWETVRGKKTRKSPGSVGFNIQKSKVIARAPQGWKQRGHEGPVDGVTTRSVHKGIENRATGSGREPPTPPPL